MLCIMCRVWPYCATAYAPKLVNSIFPGVFMNRNVVNPRDHGFVHGFSAKWTFFPIE